MGLPAVACQPHGWSGNGAAAAPVRRAMRFAAVVGLCACGGATPNLLTIRTDAMIAQEGGDFAACVVQAERAAAIDVRSIDDAYTAAACHARAGHGDAAFRALGMAIDRGYHDVELLRADMDLAALHADVRWVEIERRANAQLATYLATSNAELYHLVTEDQLARTGDFLSKDIEEFARQDAVRLARMKALVARDGLKSAGDYYSAALVAQHGADDEDFVLARTWALKAAELEPGKREARWLAAAATDRALVRRKQPQRYGTQSTYHGGAWVMNPVDPSVTDAERATWNVRPLADQKRLIESRNRNRKR